MSDFPKPRFSVGDTVYRATTTTTGARHPCPDCHDTRKWLCTSPAGQTMEMSCPRCTLQHYNNDGMNLNYTKHVPYVRKLTIGSVQIDTAADDGPVRYMCVETGVGSGSVYRESDLHPDEASANAEMESMCRVLQLKESATPVAMERRDLAQSRYLDAIEQTIRSRVKAELHEEFKHEVVEAVGVDGATDGVWMLDGNVDDSGVYRWDIRSQLPDAYGKSIASGYGGLSEGFATKDEGPVNARLMSASKELYRGLRYAIEQAPELANVPGISNALAKADGASVEIRP